MSNDATHVSLDDLADAAEERPSRARAEAVRTHARDCADCAELGRALDETRELLAADPAPRMPDAVAARLREVVAAEAERRAVGEAGMVEAYEAARGVHRTGLGSFGTNPAYAEKAIGQPRLTCGE